MFSMLKPKNRVVDSKYALNYARDFLDNRTVKNVSIISVGYQFAANPLGQVNRVFVIDGSFRHGYFGEVAFKFEIEAPKDESI